MARNNTDRFTQGYIAAVSCLIQQHDEVDTVTKEVFRSGVGNISLASLEKAGVDIHDLQLLKRFWKELH
jgi:hypothetical protein